MQACKPTVRIQTEDFDSTAEVHLLKADRTDIGAVATFTGICRDEGSGVVAMELEHYPGMATAEIERVATEAARRWPLVGLTVVHRYGRIAPGENIVLVASASSHRSAAFESAEFVMDFLKTRAPFWKKIHFSDGSQSTWVDANLKDDEAVDRWS